MKKELTGVLGNLDTARTALNALLATLPDDPVTPPPPPPVDPLYFGQNEVRYLPGVVEALSLECTYYQEKAVTTTVPSFQGARIGDYLDALVPCDKAVATMTRIKAPATLAPGLYVGALNGASQPLCVLPVALDKPYTMYAEIQSRTCMLAHGLPDNVVYQGPITQLYVSALRSFGIEPVKQNIVTYPSDIDNWKQYNASFRQLVMAGATAPICLFGPTGGGARPTVAQLQYLATNCPGSWIYAYDEGEGDPAQDAAALAYAQYLRQNAPGIKIMMTRQFSVAFAPYVDMFCPVINWFDQPGKQPRSNYSPGYGLYTSCMAQGNCVSKTDPTLVAPATAFPMMVLDAPNVHRIAFPIITQQLGAAFALYYCVTQKLKTAWNVAGQYSEGGNGDGTMFYPGTDGTPWPSRRLADLHTGLQIAQLAAKASGLGVASPVVSATSWSQDAAAYEKYRTDLLKALARKNGWTG